MRETHRAKHANTQLHRFQGSDQASTEGLPPIRQLPTDEFITSRCAGLQGQETEEGLQRTGMSSDGYIQH